MTQLLVWIDLETTGLDRQKDVILEVAVVVTDMQLRELAQFDTPVIPDGEHVDLLKLRVDDYVRNMHAQNGLWDEVERMGMDTTDAELFVLDAINRAVKEGRIKNPQFHLAGSGVSSFDLQVLEVQMPKVHALLHYQTYDVSQLRRFATTFLAERLDGWQARESTHRAMDDVYNAIDQLKDLVNLLHSGGPASGSASVSSAFPAIQATDEEEADDGPLTPDELEAMMAAENL